jgi:formylglycine-generating enzyme required for sulfatase activity
MTGSGFRRSAALNVGALLALAATPNLPSASTQERRIEHARAERRVALCIGNDTYANVEHLRNAGADARAVAAELRLAGFETRLYTDLDRRGINRALEDFVAKLSSGAIAVLFYAGHGVQIQNTNYLLGVDIAAERAGDIAEDGIDLTRALEKITSASPSFSLAIIDACRNNPFPTVAGRSIGIGRGLSAPTATPRGFMVVYSAGANQTALDRLGPNDPSPNGLFTRELLRAMRAPGLRIQDVVSELKLGVIEKAKAVGHAQHPAIYDQSTGSFYFRPPSAVEPAAQPATAEAGAVELEYWKSAQALGTIESYERYRERYPRGQFADLAELQIQKLAPAPGPAKVTPAPPVGSAQPAGDVRRSAKDGLEYAWIPPGTFQMGCVPGDEECGSEEKPRHAVTLSRGYWLGLTEVTVGAYARFANATSRKPPQAPSYADDSYPVVNVKWEEAKAFCEWSGGRLPTEAEWERAARGGREGLRFPGGDSLSHEFANYSGREGRDRHRRTAPVGSFDPNGLGLYDTACNVWEWVSDWYDKRYYAASSATDPSGPSSGKDHTLRGGSWAGAAAQCRCSSRVSAGSGSDRGPGGIDTVFGLRCARDASP